MKDRTCLILRATGLYGNITPINVNNINNSLSIYIELFLSHTMMNDKEYRREEAGIDKK